MSKKDVVGNIALVVGLGAMLVGLGIGVFQTQDEVDADATTTGTVSEHFSAAGGQGWDPWCRYTYKVDGKEYRGSDACDQIEHPVGSDITVNYIERHPAKSILGGDVTSGDIVTRLVIVIGGFGLLFGYMYRIGRPTKEEEATGHQGSTA